MTRRFDGSLLDVKHAAQLLGTTPKSLRARIARRTIPFNRLGGRVLFLKDELTIFVQSLEGCSLEEALGNMENRK
jgi:excisionase family DNA binding protein